MNHLAHCFLARHNPSWISGNLIADFVRGNDFENYPTEIQTGILMHRRIDSFTDSHATVSEAARFLHPRHHKYAPICVDVFFDYCLATKWEHYSPILLSAFTSQVNEALERDFEYLPEPLQKRLPTMIANNWLTHYNTLEGVQFAFESIAKRAKFPSNIATATDDLVAHLDFFQAAFDNFFPDLLAEISRSYP